MKNLVIFIILASIMQIAYSQKPGVGLKDLGLKGNVKQVIKFTYRGDEKVDTIGTPEKDIINFDEKGNQLDETMYDKTGQMQKMLFTYTKGRITEKQYYNGKVFDSLIHIYNDQGYEIEFDTEMGGDPSLKIVKSDYKVWYKYDAKGNKIEAKTNGTFRNSPNKTIFLYDEKNQEIESDSYLPDGKKGEMTKFYYDSLGNQIKTETFNAEGNLVSDRTVSYRNLDGHGNWQLMTTLFKSHSDKLIVYWPASIVKIQIIYFN